MSTLHRGDQIGDWIVVEPLGAGGMGSVYRCHSTLTEQVQSAVKLLAHKGVDSKARFVREVEVLSSLQHDAIVRVLGGGQHGENGALYLVMELVDGQDLDYYIHHRKLPWQDACRIIRDAAQGLVAAHEKGVHHRDIKPANLMVDADGRVKIIDFGIALQDGQTRLTRQQAVPGTMAYMPPEVFSQQDFDPARGDVYSLGMCLYETLRSKYAYPEDISLSSAQRFAAIMTSKLEDKELDPGDAFSDDLRDVVKRATAKDPASRITTATAFVEALDALLEGHKLPEWIAPAPAKPTPKTTDDTFTLDTEMLAPSPERARPRYQNTERKKNKPTHWFPFLSLMYSFGAAVAPPLWFAFFCVLAVAGLGDLATVVIALTLIVLPVVLPAIALTGMVATTWYMFRVPRRNMSAAVWWLVGLTLYGIHFTALAVSIADTALLVSIWDQVSEPELWLPGQ